MASDNLKTFVISEMTQLWDDMSPGYYNYGKLEPDVDIDSTNLSEANENMVHYVIDQLQINQHSTVLDLGSGTGMYAVRISSITGCTILGVDAVEEYVAEANDRAKEHKVNDKVEFIYGTYSDLPTGAKSQTYTHIVALGSFMYAQTYLDKILPEIAESCMNKETKFLIWDELRATPKWEDLQDTVNRHLKLKDTVLITEAEYRESITKSPLTIYDYEDFTKYIIPGYEIMAKECAKRDPEMKILTYPLMRDAFVAGELKYVMFYCKLRE